VSCIHNYDEARHDKLWLGDVSWTLCSSQDIFPEWFPMIWGMFPMLKSLHEPQKNFTSAGMSLLKLKGYFLDFAADLLFL
jgi:hypothetical protein